MPFCRYLGVVSIPVGWLCTESLHTCAGQRWTGPYDSRVLPVLLASILMVALVIVFSGAIAQAAGWA